MISSSNSVFTSSGYFFPIVYLGKHIETGCPLKCQTNKYPNISHRRLNLPSRNSVRRFMSVYPEIAPLNIMHLASPQSAILSAVIFNALIIIMLIPLALRGVQYRPIGAGPLLARSLLIYGVGGVIAPFVGIKLIDLALEAVGLI